MARSPWKVGKRDKKTKALHTVVLLLCSSQKAATVQQWEPGELCSYTFQILVASPCTQQHKAIYGFAPGYHMANTREVSALGNKKKVAGVSAGLKS